MELKNIVKAVLAFLPRGIRNRAFLSLFRHGVGTMTGLVQHLQARGFEPKTAIDIGAFDGGWSRLARATFPEAAIVMLDGNPQNREQLQQAASEFANARSEIAALGSEDREAVTFYQLGTGSSILPELTGLAMNPVTVPMRRLDDVIPCVGQGPVLIKVDVQGYELEVLRGGPRVFGSAEAVVLEVSLLPYNLGAPLFADVVEFMATHGFVVFDFCGQHRRGDGAALFQADVAFARRGSRLIENSQSWLAESLAEQAVGSV
jgi:FkbM family methyltransferase